MAKRKASAAGGEETIPARKSTRQKTSNAKEDIPPNPEKAAKRGTATKPAKSTNTAETTEKPQGEAPTSTSHEASQPYTKESKVNHVPGRQYWLMKAEPESRLEKGHDIKFSIDDLASKKEPEPWDGIRNYVARNNLRAMKKGDLAFFYHSSCKVPAIVGIMEIVREHSPDLTAQDPSAPYFDAKDNDPENPRWSVVHVVFREKFDRPITLTRLKEIRAAGKELQNMQMLKQSRLSVTKVAWDEWRFLIGLLEDDGEEGKEEDKEEGRRK